MFLLDSHCDTPSHILRLRDLAKDDRYAHVDFPKLRRGGVDGAFFALYVPASLSEAEAYIHALKLLEGVRNVLKIHPDKARVATCASEAYKNKEDGLFSVFLGLENGSALGGSLDRVEEFHEAGVRYITLCHSRNNQICDSCAQGGGWNGLSKFGKDVVKTMNRLGMLVDVSHISDSSFYDVLETSTRPVVATHSCCRALCDHPRNMTDEMIKALSDKGGVMGLNLGPEFVGAVEGVTRMEDLVAQILHIRNVGGAQVLALGSDFDGIHGALDVAGPQDWPHLEAALKAAGLSDDELDMMWYTNAERVIRAVLV
jgi:membrane dipeptidase